MSSIYETNNHLIKNTKKLFSHCSAPILFPSGRSHRQTKEEWENYTHTHAHTHTHTHTHFLKKKEENIQSCLVHTYMRNRNLGSKHLFKQENQVG